MRQKELKGATVVILAAGDLQAAAFTIEDPIRSEARAVICALQSRGIKVPLFPVTMQWQDSVFVLIPETQFNY